jgi:hypothetical protein
MRKGSKEESDFLMQSKYMNQYAFLYKQLFRKLFRFILSSCGLLLLFRSTEGSSKVDELLAASTTILLQAVALLV